MRCVRTAGVYQPDDGTMDGSVVVFADGEITAIEDSVPAEADVIAETDGYALPGLVDAHSHASIRPWEGKQLEQLRADKARGAARSITNLRTDLEAGTTTMRLMAEERHLDIELADLETEGEITAPRLLPSGIHLTPTGGHGQAITAIDGPDAIREQIRANLAAGAHHVKYFATGGVSSATGGLASAPYSDREVEAIVEEAHRQGVHVGAHAHGGPGAMQAIEAGVDTIEHAGALSAAAIDRLDGGDQHVVGTFSILNHPRGIEAGDADSPAIMAKVETARDRERDTWTRLLDHDIPIALGTDSMHGHLPWEVDHLIDLGASPERALKAVTTEAARAARIDDRVGALEPGLAADCLLVETHPIETPTTIEDPVAVIKGGERIV